MQKTLPQDRIILEVALGHPLPVTHEQEVGPYRVTWREDGGRMMITIELTPSEPSSLASIQSEQDTPCEPFERFEIRSLKDIAAYAKGIYAELYGDREHFVVIALDADNCVLGHEVVTSGDRESVDVEPNIIYHEAIRMDAERIVAMHNHPNGDSAPSDDDINLTYRLRGVSDIVDVPLFDHVIYADGACHSLLVHTHSQPATA